MEQVIKVLLQFCKDHCGKNTPSRKEIAAVLSLLEKGGELDSPQQVLDSGRWDSLTSALCQRAMTNQKAAELKTWGLILGALKAAKEEGKLKAAKEEGKLKVEKEGGRAPGSGSLESCRSDEQRTANEVANGGGDMKKGEPPDLPGDPTAPPPPYPNRPLYPSLEKLAQAELPTEGSAKGRSQVTDWAKIKEVVEERGLTKLVALPVVVLEEGGPICVPLDPKGVARVIEAVEKKGLKSPLTMNALETLTAQGPLLPYDIENLMRMVLKPVQYTLWKEEWQARLRQMLVTAQNDQGNPICESNVQRLMGSAPSMLTPQAQVGHLRPGELIATSDAALEAFRRLARNAEPSTPWTETAQGPTESFQDFADRLIKAVEGSELPRAVHSPVILDCLYQRSSEGVQALLRTASERFHTPGEVIKYVMDKQKSRPSVVGEVAAAVAGVMMAHGEVGRQITDRPPGPCFRCGQLGHLKAQCKSNAGGGVVCQMCGRRGHTAPQCRARKPHHQGNAGGRQFVIRDPLSHLRLERAVDLNLPMAALSLSCGERPLVRATISYTDLPPDFQGPQSIFVTALIDSGADVTVIAESDWPPIWPRGASQAITGVGGVASSQRSARQVEIIVINRDGSLEKPALITPLVGGVPGTLLGRDYLRSVGARITNLYGYGFTFKRGVNEALWNNKTAKALPPGIFLICGDRAWQGVPRNALGGPCYLGQLTMLSPNFTTWMRLGPNIMHHRSKRSSPLPENCNDEVELWSATARIFASVLAPGVAAAQALKQIERLACWSVKQVNLTTLVLNAMLEDTNSIRHAVLQNRAAIDFLLLAQGHGCEDLEGMCCFNLSDHSVSIHKALKALRDHTEKIRVEDDPIGDWLRSVFGSFGGWIAKVIRVIALVLLVIIDIAAILPCVIMCFQSCLSRIMWQVMDQRILYHKMKDQL